VIVWGIYFLFFCFAGVAGVGEPPVVVSPRQGRGEGRKEESGSKHRCGCMIMARAASFAVGMLALLASRANSFFFFPFFSVFAVILVGGKCFVFGVFPKITRTL